MNRNTSILVTNNKKEENEKKRLTLFVNHHPFFKEG